MAIQPDPTPEEGWEWLLDGLLPEGGILVVEHDIKRLEKQVAKLQIDLATAHTTLRKLKSGEWPTDDSGFLTCSPDNPVRLS